MLIQCNVYHTPRRLEVPANEAGVLVDIAVYITQEG